jgi:hypothetical protein
MVLHHPTRALLPHFRCLTCRAPAACAEDGSVGLAFLDSRSERNVRRMLVYDKEKRPILQVPPRRHSRLSPAPERTRAGLTPPRDGLALAGEGRG